MVLSSPNFSDPRTSIADAIRRMSEQTTKKKFLSPFIRRMNRLSENNKEAIINAIEIAYRESGLENKGVTICNYTPNVFEKTKNKYLGIKNFIYRIIYKKKVLKKLESISLGRNASYARLKSGGKQILVNMDKMCAAIFHEMGHALNHNGSWITKGLIHAKKLKNLTPIIAIIALFTKKPQTENNNINSGKQNKTAVFIKNNAGKLTFAMYIPILIEEALASIRGLKLAKGKLTPTLFKEINRVYALAWTTYLSKALLVSAGVSLAVKLSDKIRDKIAQKKQASRT